MTTQPPWRAGTAGGGSGTSISVSVPSGVAANDLCVVFFDSGGVGKTISPPDGTWTQVFQNANGLGGTTIGLWRHKATASEPGAWSFGLSSSSPVTRWMAGLWLGADVNGTPIPASNNGHQAAGSASCALGAVTPGIANCRLVGIAEQAAAFTSINVAASMTSRVTNDFGSQLGAIGDEALTGTGSTGTRTFTSSPGLTAEWSWAMFAIAPAPPAPPVEIAATGQMKLRGSATSRVARPVAATGRLHITGAASVIVQRTVEIAATGITHLTGSASGAMALRAAATGQVIISPALTAARARSIAATGGMHVVGAAGALRARAIAVAGQMRIGVSLAMERAREIAASGQMVISGAATVRVERIVEIAATGVTAVAGAVSVAVSLTVGAVGQLRIGGGAATLRGRAVSAGGTTQVGGAVGTVERWREMAASGATVISGSAAAGLGRTIGASGRLVIAGVAAVRRVFGGKYLFDKGPSAMSGSREQGTGNVGDVVGGIEGGADDADGVSGSDATGGLRGFRE